MTRTTFSAAYKLWTELLKGSKSPLTVKKYSQYLKPLVGRLGDFELTELTEKEGYITGFALSNYSTNSARRNFWNAWNSFRRFAAKTFKVGLPELPDEFVGRSEKKEPKPLKESHFKALLEAVKELPDVESRESGKERNISLKLAFYLMAFGGLRLGEALKVMPQDVQFKQTDDGREYAEVLVKGKGRKERRVPIFYPEVVAYLKEHAEELPPALTHQAVEKRLKNLYRKAVVKIGEQPERFYPNRFRDTYLTRLANNGVDIEILRQLAGHSSIDMTARYIKVSKEKINREVARVFGYLQENKSES